MTDSMSPKQFAEKFPERFPQELDYEGQFVTAEEFSASDGHVEVLPPDKYLYVPATHAGYSHDGTTNAANVRSFC